MKLWDKTKAFWNRHKVGIISTFSFIGGCTGGYLLGRAFVHAITPNESENVEIEEPIALPIPEEDDDLEYCNRILKTIMAYEEDAEKGKNRWKECPCQRERWNKVNAFANELDLGDCEYYVLEGINPDCNSEHVTFYVHHFQDDFPSYPTEMVMEQKGE